MGVFSNIKPDRNIAFIVLTFIVIHNKCYSQSLTSHYDNGKIKSESIIRENDSVVISYYESGTKKSEGAFRECDYHTNFTHIVQYGCGSRKNKRNGEWKYYYEDGKLEGIDNYICDILVGISSMYYPSGNLESNEYYNEGTLIQEYILYPNGNLKLFRSRTNGDRKIGKRGNSYHKIYTDELHEYYESGELYRISIIDSESGLKGEYIEYWPNGFIKIESEYIDNQRHGLHKEFYENGNIKLLGEFRKGKSNGKQIYYNENGSLDRTEIWKDGLFKKKEI